MTLALPLVTFVSACGPVPVEQAEASCLRDAELAARPRGEVRMGVLAGSGGYQGVAGQIDLDVSTDYLAGRDPSDVYNKCVIRRSGQYPTRSLHDQPNWRG
ncbi:hypothetical protein PAF17_13415 [Paracoccus sp. Z330]|uniref:Lipoprotein n=1 Tax=Paracoccus onchidii TaxID=3017813 RepID=A0ABT4ZGK4_9RHOB|nr:hypothetical protein [Paracoccus onchidii]MDB6178496.1 hypothetical protein [Paracoccus onchidii]